MSDFFTRFEQFKPAGRNVNGLRVAFGVDIDGCVDPGMLKHEDGFATASVQHYGLQMLTGIAKRAWMFVNCFSNDRGITRFRALYMWADVLRETPSVQDSGVAIPEFPFLRRWCDMTSSYSPEALDEFLSSGDFSSILKDGESQETAAEELHGVYEWSNKVNSNVHAATENVTAFSNAVVALKRAHEMGVDLCAVSGTPERHVITQLEKYGVLDCFIGIFAQQAGKKSAALTTMMVGPQPESAERPLLDQLEANYDVILMMGDAPKDYAESQQANQDLSGDKDKPCRMFFVEVGRENQSWKLFNDEVLDKIVSNKWDSAQESELIKRSLSNLDRVWDSEITPIDTFPKRDA